MKSRTRNVVRMLGLLFVAGCLVAATAQPLAAQVTIPQGSTINAAEFSIYVLNGPTNQAVTVHRITQDWGETSVTWNSFMSSYDPTVVGSFVTGSIGWQHVDLTGLVQAWVNGAYPNYGIVLMQGMTPFNLYHSSEAAYPSLVELRPKLEIWYTTEAGLTGHVLIQRPELAQDGVADAYIWQLYPNLNGNSAVLYTGNMNGAEKYSLIRFHFDVVPPSPGVGTPGYWMNHLEAWPEDGIVIGGRYYTKEQAYILMKKPVATDKTYSMFAALVAAKLNVMIGNDDSCIADTINAADNWMVTYYVGSGVAAGGETSPWRVGEPLFLLLDAYNNGLLCAPARD